MPKKGGKGTANNQLQSRLNMHLNHEIAKKDLGIKDYLNTFKSKNTKAFDSKLNLYNAERSGAEERMFSPSAKRRNDHHRSKLNNGNIIN